MMLKKKVVLITGVSKGIGLSCLKLCLQNNAFVVGVSRSKTDFSFLKKNYQNQFKIISGDISKKSTLKKIINYNKKNKLHIDCLVNNAGIRFRKKFLKIDINDYKKVFENNFFSIVSLCQSLIKETIKNKKKISIVNLSSIVGSRGFDELSAYGSSKGALDAFTRCIAIEFSKQVKINNVCPGAFKTDRAIELMKERSKKTGKSIKKIEFETVKNLPLGRLQEPSELGSLVTFLSSQQSCGITGTTIQIDGGIYGGFF